MSCCRWWLCAIFTTNHGSSSCWCSEESCRETLCSETERTDREMIQPRMIQMSFFFFTCVSDSWMCNVLLLSYCVLIVSTVTPHKLSTVCFYYSVIESLHTGFNPNQEKKKNPLRHKLIKRTTLSRKLFPVNSDWLKLLQCFYRAALKEIYWKKKNNGK